MFVSMRVLCERTYAFCIVDMSVPQFALLGNNYKNFFAKINTSVHVGVYKYMLFFFVKEVENKAFFLYNKMQTENQNSEWDSLLSLLGKGCNLPVNATTFVLRCLVRVLNP